jgi:hypothetical protein
MHNSAPRPASAAARLRAALETMADALAASKLEAVLNVESALIAAISALPQIRSLDITERQDARADLEAAQVALARCQRLGGSLGDFVRISLDARGQGVGYEPGRGAAATLSGRFNQRA